MLLAAAVAAVLGACAPAPYAPSGWTRATITQDGADVLSMSSSSAGAVRVDAPRSNRGSNSRALTWRADAPVSRDHGACATVSHSGPPNQDGVALRVAPSPHGGTRAITVNRNIWAGADWIYNVMLWDTSAGDDRGFGIRTAVHRAGVDMHAAVDTAAPGTPRRLCARVSGATVEWKMWPVTVAEPSWSDPAHTARVAVAPDWVYDGSPGLYIAHTPPGGWASFTAVTTSAGTLPGGTR